MSRYAYFIVLAMIAASCIPVVDEREPIVNQHPSIELSEIYYYETKIRFKLTLRDNNALSILRISINHKDQAKASPNDFSYFQQLNIQGRRLDRTFEVFVDKSKFYRVGTYEIRAVVFDKYDNSRTLIREFELKADSIPPVFENLALGLVPYSDPRVADYVACRSQIVKVFGQVRDNLLLTRVGVRFPGTLNGVAQEEIVSVLYDKFIKLDTFFKNNLVIPPGAKDGEVLTMTFYAYDTAIDNRVTAENPFSGNRVERSFKILVQCDDQPPVIEVLAVLPRFVAPKEVSLVEGGTLRITNAKVSDNKGLSKIWVAFNREGRDVNIVDSLIIRDFSTSVNLSASGLRSVFDVPPTARPGDIFNLSYFAQDSAGNFAEPYVIKISIIENQPPTIQITDTYVNGIPRAFSTSASLPLPVSASDVIRFDGKVDDDYLLSSVSAIWNGNLVISRLSPSTPFDWASAQTNTTFVVPTRVTSFELRLQATDEKGLESSKVYYFVLR